MIVFLHIPKTGGGTLASIFKNVYKKKIFVIEGQNPTKSFENYLANPHKKTDEIIYGHLDFGVLNKSKGNVKYLTMFRNPVNRIISHYNYVMSEPSHYLHRKVTLQEYLKNKHTNELDNAQVRILIGAGGYHQKDFSTIDIPFGACNEQHFKLAIQNLETHFISYGLLEYFEESILLFKKELNWKRIHYKSKNISPKILEVNDLNEKEINLIKEQNYWDIRLYQYVQKRFLEKIEFEKKYLQKEKIILKMNNLIFSTFSRVSRIINYLK